MVATMLDEAFAKIPDDTNLILHSIRTGNISTNNISGCSAKRVSGRA